MRRLLIVGVLLLLATPAAAQTTIHAGDSVTGADIPLLGDTASKSLRVSQAGTWTIGATVTNAGTFLVQDNGPAATSLALIDNLVNTIGATTVGSSGMMLLGSVSTSAPAYTTGQLHPFSLTTAGLVRVAIEAGGGTGGTAMTDNGTFTTAATSFTPIGVQYKSARRTLTDNAAGVIAGTSKGAMYVSPETTTGVSIVDTTAAAQKSLLVDTAGAALTVGTDYQHDNPLTIASSTGPLMFCRASAAVPSNVSADDDASALWCLRSGALGIQPTYAGVLASTGNGASGTGVPRFTLANDSTGILAGVTTVTTVTTVGTLTGGGVAHDNPYTANPLPVGMYASSSVVGAALVTTGDITRNVAGLDGVAITRPHANLEDLMNAVPVAITDGSSTQVAASAGASTYWHVSGVICANTSSTDVTVDVRDGTAGSVRATIPCPVGGGIWNPPVPLGGFTAATALAVDPSASASTITVTVVGFKSKIQ